MNAVIIEDVKLFSRELVFKIAEIDPTIRIIETLPSVKTALNWFGRNEEPDLVFADIELADGPLSLADLVPKRVLYLLK